MGAVSGGDTGRCGDRGLSRECGSPTPFPHTLPCGSLPSVAELIQSLQQINPTWEGLRECVICSHSVDSTQLTAWIGDWPLKWGGGGLVDRTLHLWDLVLTSGREHQN